MSDNTAQIVQGLCDLYQQENINTILIHAGKAAGVAAVLGYAFGGVTGSVVGAAVGWSGALILKNLPREYQEELAKSVTAIFQQFGISDILTGISLMLYDQPLQKAAIVLLGKYLGSLGFLLQT